MTHPATLREVELDVRDDLRNGREPFSRIMTAVDSLGEDEALHLRAIFEPAPLYKVLGRRGFSHDAERHADDDWSVWFWRGAAGGDEAPDAATAPAPDVAAAGEVWLDVRGLEPPEPMVRTLAALEALPPECTLVQVNVRAPQFLLPILTERGFTYLIDDARPDRVLVRIRRNPQGAIPVTAAAPIELDVRVIPPRDKHPTIFRTFDSLQPGQAMVIVNDHDPRPLRYQLAAERPDMFGWVYEAEGPETWRVRIDRR